MLDFIVYTVERMGMEIICHFADALCRATCNACTGTFQSLSSNIKGLAGSLYSINHLLTFGLQVQTFKDNIRKAFNFCNIIIFSLGCIYLIKYTVKP